LSTSAVSTRDANRASGQPEAGPDWSTSSSCGAGKTLTLRDDRFDQDAMRSLLDVYAHVEVVEESAI
jgi:hypothetical protein